MFEIYKNLLKNNDVNLWINNEWMLVFKDKRIKREDSNVSLKK
jgi:hypothetical protein